MTKDPTRRYAVERAVWLYRRWMMAMDAGERGKTMALGHRLNRALVYLEPEDRPDYYQQINLLRVDQTYTPERTAARADLSTAAGERVREMARQAAAADAPLDAAMHARDEDDNTQ